MLLGGVVLFDAVRLGFGWGPDGPRSGFFPFWLALIMVLCCAVHHRSSCARRPGQELRQPGAARPVLKVLWPAVAAVALMHFVGLYVASALYMGFYMRWVGRHSWVTVVAIAVGVPIGYLPGFREMVSGADAQGAARSTGWVTDRWESRTFYSAFTSRSRPSTCSWP